MSRSIVPAIESPCPKEWNQMQGDGKCRYCEHCQLHVHNLSAMTAHEQRSLFAKAEGRICVAYDESESRPVQLGLWRWWQRLTLPMRAGLALVTAFIPILSSCRSVPTPPASDPIVRDLHQSADGSVRLGKVKVEPESSSQIEAQWDRGKGGKMIAGGIMPAPLPWWKRLLHLN
ncbi:MAG: hypothetical protein NTY98_07600 [Verrucomicrobia bacterium]|nr:hypothetical protein [Verrucomicrobiota bacterium]